MGARRRGGGVAPAITGGPGRRLERTPKHRQAAGQPRPSASRPAGGTGPRRKARARTPFDLACRPLGAPQGPTATADKASMETTPKPQDPRTWQRRAARRRRGGWTLIELMLVTGLVAVLASLALSAYGQYRERARVAQAVLDIGGLAARIEQFFLENRRFPASLQAAGIAEVLDPWGRPYVYLDLSGPGNGQARKDRALVPINSDFDLYSVGPDGVSVSPLTARASQDDIIRARDGRYIGKAEDF